MALQSAGSSPRRALALFLLIAGASFGVGITGCHSAFVSASVVNQTGGPVSLIEVDYPSASFGTETLAAGATYHYRFKILGSGASKVTWTDGAHQEHSTPGPALHEDQEGSIQITLGPSGATWMAQLAH